MNKNYKAIVLDSFAQMKLYENSYLHLHSIGIDESTKQNFSTPRPLSDYLFTLILDGEGTFSFEATKSSCKKFKPGDLLLFKPGEHFHIRSRAKLKRLWFHVVGTAIPEIISLINFDEKNHAVNLSREICLDMSNTFNDLYSTAKYNPHHSLRLNSLIHTFFSYASSVATTNLVPEDFEASLEYINKNYQQDIQIHTIADIAHLNHHYYIKQFKKIYNVTPYQYIINKRFNSATSDLANTKLTIDEIAIRNGFSNRVHFSQMFKKHYGLTPIEYRKQYH